MVDVPGVGPRSRFRQEPGQNSRLVLRYDPSHHLRRWSEGRAAKMFSIGPAAVSALQPHPVRHNYKIGGDETDIRMDRLQLKENVVPILIIHKICSFLYLHCPFLYSEIVHESVFVKIYQNGDMS